MYMQGLHYDLNSFFPGILDVFGEEELCLSDYEYLTHLYPRELRFMMTVIEEYMDRYEYEGSPIFHEYPDAVTVYKMVQDVYDIIYGDKVQDNKEYIINIIGVLVCQEIYVRRRRHDRFCRYKSGFWNKG